ncbi:Syntaxin-binding protein 5, variant 2 [Entomophthora muscae]|uniref:Syntaxin-binding protein 5, variant 2 n=1 Tax=Entomophthora muscae TaxID=34485 RepID=A0ACC2SQM6_9FUNG|nr:Syntaxin-binding protein 5, variant 2 [Entomophthora muscae]
MDLRYQRYLYLWLVLISQCHSFGFPGVATCFSYDPVQKLLALGTTVGKVVILGREGVASRVKVESDQPIKHVHFSSNLPLITAVTENNHVYIIDIEKDTVNLTLKSRDIITCIAPYANSNWLLLGTDLGKVQILDLVYGYPSKYELKSIPSKINFMKLHPSNSDQILLGANNGKAYLVGLKEGKAILDFDLRRKAPLETPPTITSLCWSPEGESFVAGYSNGWLAFWAISDNSQPILIRTPTIDTLDVDLELAVPEQREPISSLTWCKHSDMHATTLILSGGEEEGQDPRLTIIKLGKELYPSVSELSAELPFKTVNCLKALPSSYPWGSGTQDPFAILVLSAEGALLSYNVDGDALVLPELLDWLGSDIIHTQPIANCPSNIHHSLLEKKANTQEPQLNLQGGLAQPRHEEKYLHDLVLTSHGDGSLKLWDASTNELSNLKHATISPSQQNLPCGVVPKRLEFCSEVEGLCVGYSDSTVRLLRFCHELSCQEHDRAQTPNESSTPQTPEQESPSEFFIKANSREDLLKFELFGHKDGLAAMESKFGLLATSDKSGRFTITRLKDCCIIFSETDVSLQSTATSDQPTEYLVKLDISFCDASVRILGISNLANGYFYLLAPSSDKVIAKEKVFSNLLQGEQVNSLLFYSGIETTTASEVSPTLPHDKSLESRPSISERKSVASRFRRALNKLNESANKSNLWTEKASRFEPLPSDYFNSEDHVVLCLPGKIVLYALCSRRVVRILEIRPERGRILKATPVSLKDQDMLVCIKTTGFVDIYKLPGLQVLYRSDAYLSPTFNADQCVITDDGRVMVNVNKNELRQLCLIKDHQALSFHPKAQLFDPSKEAPKGSSGEGSWFVFPFSKSRTEDVQHLFNLGRPENIIPIDRTKNNQHVNLKVFTSAADYIPPISPVANSKHSEVPDQGGNSAMAAAINRNKELLREREDKLSQIGDKTQAAADSAQDFLKEIREFNQKQAKKKWYQL